MRFTLLLFLIAQLFMFASCSSDWSNADEDFAQTYARILIAREKYPDTAKGNAEVLRIIKERGMEEPEFRQMFMSYSQKPEKLRAIMDTVHTRIRMKRVPMQ
ncbi:MAG: hypothetical protein ACK5F4_03065 [Ignavibacteria bacterium]|jgi:hypothetical protein